MKEYGGSGVRLEFVQVHVIALQLKTEQEIILEVYCHAQGMLQKWPLVAKVKIYHYAYYWSLKIIKFITMKSNNNLASI